MSRELIQHIRQFTELTDDQADFITASVSERKVLKKELLLTTGDICRVNYFVVSGCLRMFFTDEQGMERTIQFAIENWWMTDYTSKDRNVPSQYSIQAVEDSMVISLDNETSEKLFATVPAFETYFRKILQRAYAASLFRIGLLYSRSKEEMFFGFQLKYPEFVQRVPQYMLASLLGMTPEYLSELRKKTDSSVS
ncbi:Crp/Fnr family transcriptional regulator [Prolixibacter denitrificans]|uniref:cAMP-binding protein n=1 Tax=Prolixibacter denitrificans TaxID=1541063 RepID=A0A2P8CFC8_9BACT|nr:Crp/Fnr family transcriptional regulator [Prolixibacter denitrificans]PSK83678.1 CRP-like cAMP-binding protein [Prolixibacter denitrificans]GET23223.1 cAMP-binding protein [Prolixibacter denitrificans]